MPLPRPFVGRPGYVEPSQKDGEENTRGRKRPIAPISASAFSFQLATPTKPTALGEVKREMVGMSTPSRYATPLREVSAPTSTPGSGPSKPKRPLNSLPSPYGGQAFKLRTPAAKMEGGTRMSDMAWGSAKVLGKRKEDDVSVEGKEVGSPGPTKTMRSLGQLGKVDLGEKMHVEEVKKRVEEEGIGVSPRGKKIVKYSGKGPPPLSFVLNNALSSQQSSLVLFYASLQSTLFPRLTPRKTRITPSALTDGALKPIPKGPSVLQHLRTAPLVMTVKAVVHGRTGWSVMCRCEVLKGHVGQQELVTDESKGKNALPSISTIGTDQHAPETDTDPINAVLLVLQPLPQDCARLGLDPRILNLKPPSPGVLSYEIGIWPAWSDTSPDDHLVSFADNSSDPPLAGMYHQVVFASRYLIADSTASAPAPPPTPR